MFNPVITTSDAALARDSIDELSVRFAALLPQAVTHNATALLPDFEPLPQAVAYDENGTLIPFHSIESLLRMIQWEAAKQNVLSSPSSIPGVGANTTVSQPSNLSKMR